MRNKAITFVSILLLGAGIVFFPAAFAYADVNAYGYVLDSDGTAIPNADVIFTDEADSGISYRDRTDSSGWYEIPLPVSVKENKPSPFTLYQNYPNPFNPSTTIAFSLDRAGYTVLNVYNILGQKIATLADGYLQAGYHTIVWNASDSFGSKAGTGIYIYRLESGGVSVTKKMLLLDGGGTGSGVSAVTLKNSGLAGGKSVKADGKTFTVTIIGDGIDIFETQGVTLSGSYRKDFTVARSHAVPFDAHGKYLGIWNGDGYTPFFLNGVNLGVSVPGTQPGELAATSEQYRRWFNRMGEMGINVIRIYTLHYPRFYEELYSYNLAHRDNPLYLFQGIWLDEEYGSTDLYDESANFGNIIEENIDCVHGNCEIDERQGRAWGKYKYSIARWTIGYIIGREVYPDEILTTNGAHPSDISYQGQAVSVSSVTPSEVWVAGKIDKTIVYEREKYGSERPVSFSSWPTLDPLSHPSEPASTREDIAYIDLENIDDSQAPAGVFISYHAYPYYPDFMSNDPDYQSYSDSYGANSYIGYLTALKSHYSGHPLVVAEYGVPSSWGNAHFAESGMDHGGLDEIQQGNYCVRMMNNIYDTGCAGAIVFAWIDEWTKNSWITEPVSTGTERRCLWHNVTNPEQNFGLIAFTQGAPDYSKWNPVNSDGYIGKVESAFDNEYFYCRLTLSETPVDGKEIIIAYDTYRSDLGESILPDSAQITSRAEFALKISLPDTAQLYVTEAYDTFGIWHGVSGIGQLYHSIPTDGARWNPVRWKNNSGDDDIQQIGRFRIGYANGEKTSLDAVTVDGNEIEVRIPWTLLNFTDPSALEVLDDDRQTSGRETALTDGVCITVSCGAQIIETPRYIWSQWNIAPSTVEREKESMSIIEEGFKQLFPVLNLFASK